MAVFNLAGEVPLALIGGFAKGLAPGLRNASGASPTSRVARRRSWYSCGIATFLVRRSLPGARGRRSALLQKS